MNGIVGSERVTFKENFGYSKYLPSEFDADICSPVFLETSGQSCILLSREIPFPLSSIESRIHFRIGNRRRCYGNMIAG